MYSHLPVYRSRSYLPRQCCSCCNHRLFVRSSSARGLAQVPTALSRPSRSDRPTVPPLKLPQQQRQLSQGQAATLITWRAFSGSPRGDKSRVEGRRVATAAAAEEEEDGEERARAWAKAGVSEEVARTSGRGVPNLRDKGEKTNRGAIDSVSWRRYSQRYHWCLRLRREQTLYLPSYPYTCQRHGSRLRLSCGHEDH